MGKLTGLLMIAAGVGTAAYVYPLMTAPDAAEKQLAEIVAISTPGATPTGKASSPSAPPRIVSADTAGVRPTPSPPAAATRLTVSAPSVGQAAAAASGLPPPSTAQIASAPLTPPAVQAAPRPIEPPVPQPARRTKADEDRSQLARDIQRELKRVGCFAGDVDGAWSPSTRAAMKSFIERVNATLPTDEPDHILKTLVQGHPGQACGKGCPNGQTAAADGRCLPSTIVAQPASRRAVEPARPSSDQASLERKANPAGEASSGTTSAWAARVTPAPTESAVQPQPAPSMAAIAAATIAAAGSAKPSDLPGRMSVGAASTESTQTAAAQPPVTTFKADDTSRPKIIVKPRVDKVGKPEAREQADQPDDTKNADPAKQEKADRSERPAVGAVAAAESARRTAPPLPPVARVAALRAPPPPPRYVGAYNGGGSSSRARPRFGPQIFRQLESSGR